MTTRRFILVQLYIFAALLFSACQSRPGEVNSRTITPSIPLATARRTPTATSPSPPKDTLVPSPSSPPTATLTPTPSICSPLVGYSRLDLEAAVFNPFNPPAAGLDGPHQGVDFADLEPVNHYAQAGLAVQAVLTGQVAAVIDDRFPYGNALMIETPLFDLPSDWLESLHLPPVQPPQTPHPALTCPEAPLPDWDLQARSLYLLYAHMQQAPQLELGDRVSCGQTIGAVGSSGNALNPHLHLEIRVGPGGARFESMAHYDPSASPKEMANYCSWRVRGVFQLVDPMLLINQLPGQPAG